MKNFVTVWNIFGEFVCWNGFSQVAFEIELLLFLLSAVFVRLKNFQRADCLELAQILKPLPNLASVFFWHSLWLYWQKNVTIYLWALAEENHLVVYIDSGHISRETLISQDDVTIKADNWVVIIGP